MSIAEFLWPLHRLAEGVEELARQTGLRPASGEPLSLPQSVLEGGIDELDHWFSWAGDRLGIDIDAVASDAHVVGNVLLGVGPAVVRIPHETGMFFILLVRARSGRASLIAPDLSRKSCPMEAVRAAICTEIEAPLFRSVDAMLEATGIDPSRRAGVRASVVREHLAGKRVRGFWMLRLPATANFARQLSYEGAFRRLGLMLALFALAYGLEILGWAIIGDAALHGRIDFGWLWAWVLLVISTNALRLAGEWIDMSLAISAGGLLKLRLLAGALRFDLQAVKSHGVGQMLGRVMECHALESLAVNGGLAAVVAVMELAFAIWILAQGAAGLLHVALLVVWLAVICVLGWRYYLRLSKWTMNRLDMTHALIEQMVGHRTRLAQERPERRDESEDRLVKDYLAASSDMDSAILPFLAGAQGGWVIVGLLGLVPAFVAGASTPAAFAVALGGMLMAGRALAGISGGLSAAARAAIAWRQAGPLFRAGAKSNEGAPYLPRYGSEAMMQQRLVDADSLTFGYGQGAGAVLKGASLTIGRGERILVEGPSGGGKSTLASLLVGLRQPASGLLLLNGLDRHTLGDEWHRIATEAPQFHENHVFTATLGFNLLMGHRWPPSEADLKMAEELCVELGLGNLLSRMPSGLMQTVGETGWQLSHGERSRIFLARALLQNAELTILDESFAALDPETLRTCLDCAFRRAKTLMVVAHP